MDRFTDTIVALSTPPGISGIGIIRLSGPQALAIAQQVFRPADPRKPVAARPTYSLLYGHVVDGEQVVDEALLGVMRAPRTYTTQDTVEINCHGGLVPLRRTLELCLAHGARLADPGEFTRRAFYFGRLDLAQAEAVADLINARTEAAARAALGQLQGGLSQRIEGMREGLVALLAQLEAQLDFGEDDVEEVPLAQIAIRLEELLERAQALLATAEQGKLLRQGARVAIAGRPNVGKSSLMNALLGEERMIVTPLPGTTRDTVEESLNLGGAPVVLVDTAGLREAGDELEQAGVQRARRALAEADLVLLVLDRSVPLETEDGALLAELPQERTVLVANKCDLPAAWERLEDRQLRPQGDDAAPDGLALISARTHQGLDRLRATLAQRLGVAGLREAPEVLITSVRHQQALQTAAAALQRGLSSARRSATEEYLAEDLRAALAALGEITGAVTSEEIIDRVFERFCIGK